jgi:hypothetical protein
MEGALRLGGEGTVGIVTKYAAVVAAAQRAADAADEAYALARARFDFADPVAVAVLEAQTRAHAALTVVESASRRGFDG